MRRGRAFAATLVSVGLVLASAAGAVARTSAPVPLPLTAPVAACVEASAADDRAGSGTPDAIEVTPEQFGARPDGNNSHGALAAMFACLDSRGGGRVVLSAGTGPYVFNGDLTVPSRVTITGQGTLKVARSATASRGLVLAGERSRIESGVTLEGGRRTLTVTGDHVFVDATVSNSGDYAFDIYGDYCTVGNNAKAVNAGYAGMRLFARRALNRFDLGRFESINHRYKGFVYNGTGSVGEINIGSLRAVTNTGEAASDGLLIDSGDADGATVRVGTFRAAELHLEGHRSNGFKIQNTRHIELGKVYNRNAAAGIPTSSGGKILVSRHSTFELGSMDTDNRLQLGGAVGEPPGSARVGRVQLAGRRPSAALLIRGSGYDYTVEEVDARGLGAGAHVFNLAGGGPARLAVGRVLSAAKTFRIESGCRPGSITVAETVGYANRRQAGSCVARERF